MSRAITAILFMMIMVTASGCQNAHDLNATASNPVISDSPSAQVGTAKNNDTQHAKDQTVIAFAEDRAKKEYETVANDFQEGIVLASEDSWYLVKINCTNSYNQAKQEIYIILQASQFVYDIDGNLTADIKYNKNILVLPSGTDIFQTTFIMSCGWTTFTDGCRRIASNAASSAETSQSDLNSDIQPCPVKNIYDTYNRDDYVDNNTFSMYYDNYIKKDYPDCSWGYMGTTTDDINPNPFGFDGYDVFRVVFPGIGESWYLVPYSKNSVTPVVYFYDFEKNEIQRVWTGQP